MDTGVHYPLRIDALPSGWRAGYVGDFAKEIEPGFASGEHNQTGDGVAHLRPMNIDRDGRMDLSVTKFVSPQKDRRRLAVGDVLFNNTNSPELVGKTVAVNVTGDFAFSNHMTRIRFADGVLPTFGALQLHFLWMRGYFKYNCVKHVNQASVSSRALARGVPFVWAPPIEQERIVAELEKQFSRLDKAVANLKRVKASISRYQALTLSEVAGSDGRWTTCTIADLLRERIVNGLSVKESTTPTSVRALRLSAMSECGLNYADHRFVPVDPASVDDIRVEKGDFFVSRGNGSLALVGRGATAQTPPFPVIFPDTMMRLRFVDADVGRWVATLWPSRLVRRQVEQRVKTTAGIYKIAQPQVASISLPLPPPSECERIVAEVDRRLSIVREVEAEVDANLKRAQALRQAVLTRAFAG
jgi:type I restriction enzyme S subunit